MIKGDLSSHVSNGQGRFEQSVYVLTLVIRIIIGCELSQSIPRSIGPPVSNFSRLLNWPNKYSNVKHFHIDSHLQINFQELFRI